MADPTPTPAAATSAAKIEANAAWTLVKTWVTAHAPTVLAFVAGVATGALLF